MSGTDYCYRHRIAFPLRGSCSGCLEDTLLHPGKKWSDVVEVTWNTAYPERRPWSEIGEEAQAEWRRVFAIYDSLKP